MKCVLDQRALPWCVIAFLTLSAMRLSFLRHFRVSLPLSAQGLFDFFYLPIDFKNNCNKGYAFINMIDPKSILSLHMNFNGHRWKHFKSEKVCAITYARIQGKQHMIDRFQVSETVARSPFLLFLHCPPTCMLTPPPFPSPMRVPQNSSVMKMASSWRPLIFHSDGPNKGKAQEFPVPDGNGSD
jgi:hypothetical protein